MIIPNTSAAGDDQIKVTEICIHIEREPVRSHPARDMHADGGNLAAWSVHTGQALNAKGFNSEIPRRSNQDFLQIADEAMHVFPIRAQVDNWITYDLAQPVIGNFAATIRFNYSDGARTQDFIAGDYATIVGAAAERQRGRVLE